jgi:hypothetical protein
MRAHALARGAAGGVGGKEMLTDRREETAQVETEAQRSLARKSPKNEGSRGREVEKRLVRVAEPRVTFLTFRGPDLTLDGYRSRYSTTGLLIARGETILVERYQYGRP